MRENAALAHSFIVSAILLGLLASVPVQADDSTSETAAQSRLQSDEAAMAEANARAAALEKQARKLAAEIALYRQSSIETARRAQELEQRIAELEAKLHDIDRQIAASKIVLDRHRAEQAASLAALERIAIEPPAALVFSPGSPVDSLRSAMLLGAIVPRLRAEAQRLADEIARLDALRQQATQDRVDLGSREQELEAERQRLAELMRQRQALETADRQQSAAAARQAAQFAAEATGLRDLIQRLEQAQQQREAAARAQESQAAQAVAPAPERRQHGARPQLLVSPAAAGHAAGGTLRSFDPGTSHLLAPVSGRITRYYGSGDGYVSAKGLTVQTAPGGTVVSPFDGQVLFAGNFRSYGLILIIDHGGGYASLLAGLGRLDAAVGQRVIAGEPVGTMPSGPPRSDLYFELRRQDQPIDPLPWLSAR